MATPNDRRIIWGSHVIPQVSYSTTNTQVTRDPHIILLSFGVAII
jgi:hypothetical protein